jgi:hypothetical protein
MSGPPVLAVVTVTQDCRSEGAAGPSGVGEVLWLTDPGTVPAGVSGTVWEAPATMGQARLLNLAAALADEREAAHLLLLEPGVVLGPAGLDRLVAVAAASPDLAMLCAWVPGEATAGVPVDDGADLTGQVLTVVDEALWQQHRDVALDIPAALPGAVLVTRRAREVAPRADPTLAGAAALVGWSLQMRQAGLRVAVAPGVLAGTACVQARRDTRSWPGLSYDDQLVLTRHRPLFADMVEAFVGSSLLDTARDHAVAAVVQALATAFGWRLGPPPDGPSRGLVVATPEPGTDDVVLAGAGFRQRRGLGPADPAATLAQRWGPPR